MNIKCIVYLIQYTCTIYWYNIQILLIHQVYEAQWSELIKPQYSSCFTKSQERVEVFVISSQSIQNDLKNFFCACFFKTKRDNNLQLKITLLWKWGRKNYLFPYPVALPPLKSMQWKYSCETSLRSGLCKRICGPWYLHQNCPKWRLFQVNQLYNFESMIPLL